MGLVSHWPFNGSAKDRAHGNHPLSVHEINQLYDKALSEKEVKLIYDKTK